MQTMHKLTEHKESMSGGEKHQDPAQEILADDVVLDVICMVLHTEGQQLQDQAQQLCSLVIIYKHRHISQHFDKVTNT